MYNRWMDLDDLGDMTVWLFETFKTCFQLWPWNSTPQYDLRISRVIEVVSPFLLRFLHHAASHTQVSISSISSTLAQSQEWRQSLSSLRLMARKETREVLKHKMEVDTEAQNFKIAVSDSAGNCPLFSCMGAMIHVLDACCSVVPLADVWGGRSRVHGRILLTATPTRGVDRWRLGVRFMPFPLHRRSPWSPQLWWCLWAKGFNGNMAWHICSVPTLELWMHTPCPPPSCHVDAGRK